jgi:murein DD-endopeptidase MepM/ murein hydrolase activator NlpD
VNIAMASIITLVAVSVAPAGGPPPDRAPGVPPAALGACPVSQRYLPPLSGMVVDPFRAPSTPFGPGNRGLEYATSPGTDVRAIGAGTVTFAGAVGGSRHVTVAHADGLRSSYSYLAEVLVEEGHVVAVGEILGRTADRFHLGVRCGAIYVDPAELLATTPDRVRARLVPNGRFPGG